MDTIEGIRDLAATGATFRLPNGTRVEVVVSDDYDQVHEPTVVVRAIPHDTGDDWVDDPDRDHWPAWSVSPAELTEEVDG